MIKLSSKNDKIILIIFAVFLVIGIYQAVSLAWCCDDAFLSFRCAKNLVDGNGLVYNIGERVEVYTNFLWTIIIAFGLFINLDPVLFSQILSTICFVITAIIFFYLSRQLANKLSLNSLFILPMTSLVLLVHHEFAIFATTGLETMMATMLVSLGFAMILSREYRYKYILTGLVYVLAIMTRPDMAIFVIATGLYLIKAEKLPIKKIIYFAMPFIIICLPYWAIKYSYYGYLFPNSFYAKSGSGSNYVQGWTYLWLYLKTYYALILIAPAMIFALFKLLNRFAKSSDDNQFVTHVWYLSVLSITLYLFYVVRVGGDFMFARFLIPITPILFFFIESILMRLNMNKIFRIALPIILILTVLFRWHQFDPPEIAISGIADERVAYPAELIDQAKAEGAILSKYFGDMKIRTAFYGKKAMLAYYSNVFCAHEAAASLTDVDMAHLPIQKRGRPGHEKRMPYPYLVQKEINFVLGGTFRSEENPDLPNVIIFEDVVAHIVVYKNEIMDELKKHPGVRFLDFPDYLDSYLEQADSYPKHKVTSDLHFFRQYYFEHNNDFERYQAIQKLQ